jgi:small subunit ribosomal protein S15
VRTSAPYWTTYSPEEIEEIVLRLNKDGMSKGNIGIVLRDQYGVAGVRLVTGKRLTRLLSDNGIKEDYPEDFLLLMRKAVNLRDHLGKNRSDIGAKNGLTLVEAKIRRLQRYYWKTGALPKDWRYDPEKAALLVG